MSTASTIDTLHETLVRDLRKALGTTVNAALAPEDVLTLPGKRQSLNVPAVFIGILDMKQLGDDGTERLSLAVRWQTLCCTAYQTTTSRRVEEARRLALATAQFLHKARLGIEGVSPMQDITLQPLPLAYELSRSLVAWEVQCQHTVYLGENVWDKQKVNTKTIELSDE